MEHMILGFVILLGEGEVFLSWVLSGRGKQIPFLQLFMVTWEREV